MPTDMLMMDAWRARSNERYKTLVAMRNAPALFTTEYKDEILADLKKAEDNYHYWRTYGEN